MIKNFLFFILLVCSFISLSGSAEDWVVVVATFGSPDRAEVQKKELDTNYDDVRIKTLNDKYIVMVAGFGNLEEAKDASQKLVNQFKDCFVATYETPTKIIAKPTTENPSETEPGWLETLGGLAITFVFLWICWKVLVALFSGGSSDRNCPECKSSNVSIKSTETKEGVNQKTKKHQKTVKHTYICGKCKTSWSGKTQKV